MTQSQTSRLPSWLVGSGVIAIAMGVMNVATYAFTILAARWLGPQQYGALAALMGLLLIVTVVALGLQATGARQIAASPGDVARIEADIISTSYRAALAVGALCLVATPVVASTLRLDSWLTATLLGVTAIPLTLMGGQAGLLQGERRWLSLAIVYLAVGVGRVLCGVLGLLWRPDALGAMIGVAVGSCLPAIIGWFALRHPGRRGSQPTGPADEQSGRPRGVIREVAHSSHALLAFFALSNADVVVARSVLDDQQSGLYAGGLILTKAVLFLPQFVVVVAFPAMSSIGARRSMHLKGLVLVLGIGSVATLGAWLLSSLALTFIGGPGYSDIEPLLWVFAGIGTLLAMIQLMVYSVLARRHQKAVYVVWAGLLTLLTIGVFADSVTFLLTVVGTTMTLVLVVLLVASLRKPDVVSTRAG